MENILKLQVVEYDWNDNLGEEIMEEFKLNNKLHSIGLIAQDVRNYYPEIINIENNEYYSMNYEFLNAVVVEAIKEQQVFIEDIDKQTIYLESKLI